MLNSSNNPLKWISLYPCLKLRKIRLRSLDKMLTITQMVDGAAKAQRQVCVCL